MRKLLLLFLLSLFVCSCTQSADDDKANRWTNAPNKIKVLCTIEMISDLVRQIGQEHVEVLTLICGDLNPHSYEFVKGDEEKLLLADLVFYNGLGLEHSPSLLHYLQKHRGATALGDLLLQQPNKVLQVEGRPDPHIWMDVSLWQELIDPIAHILGQKDALHREQYLLHAAALKECFKTIHAEICSSLHKIDPGKRYLVSSHDAFQYFARAYLSTAQEIESNSWHIRCMAPEGLAPDSQISPSDIQQIIKHLSKYSITTLFTESNVSKDSIRKILDAGKQQGLDLHIAKETLYSDAMGPTGSDGDSYLKMVQHNARIIAAGLQPARADGTGT